MEKINQNKNILIGVLGFGLLSLSVALFLKFKKDKHSHNKLH
jgi:LPXTG-motif cell wall-anchored protein